MPNKFHPILFSTPMVQGIEENRKTQTRRVCKHQFWAHSELVDFNVNKIHKRVNKDVSSKYQIGDILWVREMHYAYGWWIEEGKTNSGKIKKRFVDFTLLDGEEYHYCDFDRKHIVNNGKPIKAMGWYKRNSLFMPKEAARIFLKVTNVRVERLNDITDCDAINEGVESGLDCNGKYKPMYRNYLKGRKDGPLAGVLFTATDSFKSLWIFINGFRSWEKNPFVFVYDFERIEKPNDFL